MIFKLSKLNSAEISWYLTSNNDVVDPKLKNLKYTKGLPQGLPHTYFMANIFMLMVQEVYKEFFPGEMLFYVDDSVIFTNGINGKITDEEFYKSIENLNEQIRSTEQQLLYNDNQCDWIVPQEHYYSILDYGVKVHSAKDSISKSVFSDISYAKNNSGELYLKSLSRETSNIGFDIATVFSDSEAKMVASRTNAILDAINRELREISKDDPNTKVYYDKLLRYKKFFSYRKTLLDYKNTGDIKALKSRVLSDIKLRECSGWLKTFYEKYTDDILAVNIHFVFKRCSEESIDITDLIKAVKKLNTKLYGKNTKHKTQNTKHKTQNTKHKTLIYFTVV